MRKIVFALLLILSIQCFAQSSSDTLSVFKMNERMSEVNMSLMTSKQKQSLLYQAGDCFQMSGYMQYAAIGTGALAGVVAIIASNKDGDRGDKLRTGAYMIAGFALAFEFASITYRIKGGRRLKLAAGTDGASVALNF